MKPELLISELKASREFFERSTRNLSEEDSAFSPAQGSMTVAQQVAHAASTIEWLLEGAFSATGFDLDFESHAKQVASVTSLKDARAWLDRAYAAAFEKLSVSSESDLSHPMAAGPIMGGEPRSGAFLGIVEHTAHHRGALTVYTRLLGKVPPMPYMDC